VRPRRQRKKKLKKNNFLCPHGRDQRPRGGIYAFARMQPGSSRTDFFFKFCFSMSAQTHSCIRADATNICAIGIFFFSVRVDVGSVRTDAFTCPCQRAPCLRGHCRPHRHTCVSARTRPASARTYAHQRGRGDLSTR
jgi:hypothetical protein